MFELRQYRMLPGMKERFVEFMETEFFPYAVGKGMVVVGSFVGIDDPDLYTWIVRFEGEEERKRLYAEAFSGERWDEHFIPNFREMMDRDMKITPLEATPASVIR